MMLEGRQETGSEDGTPLEVWQEIGNEAGGQEQNLVAGVQDQRSGVGELSMGLVTLQQDWKPSCFQNAETPRGSVRKN